MLLNLIISQSFAFFVTTPALAQAPDFSPQDLPTITQTYQPTKSVVVAPTSTPLSWENADLGLVTDLKEDATSSSFSLTNSSALRIVATTTPKVVSVSTSPLAGSDTDTSTPSVPVQSLPQEASTSAVIATTTLTTASTTPSIETESSTTPVQSGSNQQASDTPGTAVENISTPAEVAAPPATSTSPDDSKTETQTPVPSVPAPAAPAADQQPAPQPATEIVPAPDAQPTSLVTSQIHVLAGDVQMADVLQSNANSLLGPEASSPAVNSVPTPSADLGGTTPSPAAPLQQQVTEPSATAEVNTLPVPAISPVANQETLATQTPVQDIQPTASSVPTSLDAPSTTPEDPFVPLLDLIPSEPIASATPASTTPETPEAVLTASTTTTTTPEVLQAPSLLSPDLPSSPALEYSGFDLVAANPDLATGTKPNTLKVKLSLSSLPATSGRLVLEYALATSSWQSLTAIDLSSGSDNADNKGYFMADLPLALYSQLSSVQLRLTYQADAESLNRNLDGIVLFLDGVSIEAGYPDYSWDEEDLAAMKLPPLTPEQFSHLEFFSPLTELFMPSDLGTNPITVGSKQKTADVLPLRLLPLGVSTATPPTRAGEVVTYSDAFSSTDLEYKLTDTGLKENIILKDNSHPAKFRYLANFDGYDALQTNPSTVVLYKKGHKGEALFKRYTLSAPVMTDAKGIASDKLVFRLKGNLLTLTPDAAFLKDASYPVVIDPTVDLSVLNVSSFPVAGEYWTIDFTTVGQDTLTITPGDEATVQDMDFSTLTCGGNVVTPNILPGGVIEVPNWTCDSIGEVKFLDKKTGHHHMIFTFGSVTQDAYNGANVYTGASGGNWNVPGNWSLGTVPTSTDDAIISSAVTVNLTGSTSPISSLTLGVSGGGTASTLNFAYDAIGSSSPLNILGNLTVYSGAVITHSTGNSAIVARIYTTVGGNATIAGSINVDQKGYTQGNGPGAGTSASNQGTGGSYGGRGSTNAVGTPQTPTYGSYLAPIDMGSSGGVSNGGNCAVGGGAIWLNVTGTTTLTGTLSARGGQISGNCGYNTGGAAGGSVYLNTNAFTGGGSVNVSGGYGGWDGGAGSGGGGRIAILANTYTATITATSVGGTISGRTGESGTVYIYPPRLTTGTTTTITDTTAVGSGAITGLGLNAITQYGHVVGTSSNPTLANAVFTSTLGATSSTGTFTSNITGLLKATTYHIRSYVTATDTFTTYGNDITFTTADYQFTQENFRFYQNADAVQPAAGLANENTGIVLTSTATPIRLRMSLLNSGILDVPTSTLAFKLQVSTATTTGWLDVVQSSGGPGWWNSDWANRRKIYFNNSGSQNDLTDYPVLVYLNATSSGNIDYSKVKAGGADLRFLAYDNATPLAYRIEKWDPSATSTIWVRVPTIKGGSNADFMWMYYNNSAATDNSTTTAAIWDSNFNAVYNFGDVGTLSINDITANAQNFTTNVNATSVQGQILGGAGFSGSQYMTRGAAAFPTGTAARTSEVWFKMNSSGINQSLGGWGDNSTDGSRWNFWYGSNTVGIEGRNRGAYIAFTYDTNWHHLAAVSVNGNSNMSSVLIYLDGTLRSLSSSSGALSTTASNVALGTLPGASNNNNFNGSLDDFRVSNVVRNGDWILADYKNGINTFLNYAAEESRDLTVLPYWNFYNNPSVATSVTISSVLLSTSNVQETYNEANPSTLNPNAIAIGQVAEWDFALDLSRALVNTNYYFRMIRSDGTLLNAYSNYPSLILNIPVSNEPYAPYNLGAKANIVNGLYRVNVSTPTLNFSLSDPDAADTVKYRIQISANSNYSSPAVDYTSALQAQGLTSFTVGQATTSGSSYTAGFPGQTLADGNYYWRVMTMDSSGLVSTYTPATTLTPAFQVQAVTRTVTWTGSAGTGNWEDFGNWNTNMVPGPNDDVVIDANATVNINASTTVKSVTLGNAGGTSAPTLSFNYDALNNGALVTTGDFTINLNAILSHSANLLATTGTVNLYRIKLSVGNNLWVNGSINADSKGFTSQQGLGAGTTNSNN
ncbi:MAG: DUF2341 domain-containing protein, partial [Patescibacteria group bacterium]|nr:DUF2341 domain-containing protein [Patescibacteria group bacterium]